MKKLFAVVSVLLMVALCACGGDDAGQSCELTQAGAAKCSSGICLQIQCTTGGAVNVCAGDKCSGSCPGDAACVEWSGQGYCIPQSVCR